ncbi:MAG: ABC transporter ATP-binding protein [Kiritimatiellae bacterium]|nr:ABC transporter ATP-binding protein [Kiritimatiellia bacterium]
MSADTSAPRRASLRWFGIPKLWPFLRPFAPSMAVMVLFGFAGSACDAAFPLFNRHAIDHFIGEGTLDGIWAFAALYFAVIVAQTLSNFVSAYLCAKLEVRLARDLRDACFNHLQTLSLAYFNQNKVGYVHSRVMSDTNNIGLLVSWTSMDLVWSASYLVGMVGVMFAIQARLALVVMALVPPAVLLGGYFQRRLVALNRRIRDANAKITDGFNEGVTGAKTIKALVVEDAVRDAFERNTGEMRRVSVHATHFSALFTSTMAFAAAAALSLVLWRGGRLTLADAMQIGTLSVFLSYAMGMVEPLQSIVRDLASIVSAQVNIERVSRLLETESDVRDAPEVVARYGDVFEPRRENWEELAGDVAFEDVTFRYPDGKELVLEHFNLRVPRGTMVAIVGETGAGKSTLVNLACRFFEPTSGRVLVDGRDVRERSQLWLHSQIGYVLQSPHLFSGTVRDNLRYGNPAATDAEIREALRLVSADAIVDRMEKGLDSEVGEGGEMLSTGEKQLLSFARALLANPRILVLDEATASVDTVTEKIIQDAIGTILRGRTSFVIAHRLSTIVGADVILVVHDGKIIERGTHRELMARQGHYHALFTRQYEDRATAAALDGRK